MRLKTKIIGILLIILSLYAGLSFGIQRLAVFPSFLSLERMLAERDLNRCVEALRRELHHLDIVTHDWAAWDDTYRFLEERHSGFIDSNLGPKTFFDNQFNMIYICTPEGKLVWGEVWDINSRQRIFLPEFPSDEFGKGHIFISNKEVESTISGIFMTEKGPMLISSRPVITSNHAGPIRGYLMMGRFLDGDFIRALEEQTNVRHEYQPIKTQNNPEGIAGDARAVPPSPEGAIRFDSKNVNTLRIATTFPDIFGNPALMIQASIPREVYAKGTVTIRYAMVLVCIAGMLILICLWLLMNSNVLNPITDLTRQVMKIRGPDHRQLQKSFSRRTDEIGDLYREFETMLADQNHFHDSIVDTNQKLIMEIQKRQESENMRIVHENKLRELAAELLFTEERERRRLAGDLHDRIGQALALSQIKLGLLMQQNPNCCLIRKMTEVHDYIEQIIQDTRALTFEVSPPVLYELGFEAAVEWFAEETEKRNNIKVHIDRRFSGTLTEETLNVFAFRAIRELILNVVKHANAQNIEVRIRHGVDQLHLAVIDDGAGFDTASLWPLGQTDCGFGLFSIQERTESLGGRFFIHSAPGQGTRAEITLPKNKIEGKCR